MRTQGRGTMTTMDNRAPRCQAAAGVGPDKSAATKNELAKAIRDQRLMSFRYGGKRTIVLPLRFDGGGFISCREIPAWAVGLRDRGAGHIKKYQINEIQLLRRA